MHYEIESLSPGALAWLQASSSPRVLHVFEPVVNLINSEGRMLSLVSPPIGNGPFSALADPSSFSSFSSDSTVSISNNSLAIDSATFSFASAKYWQAAFDFSSLDLSSSNWTLALQHIQDLLSAEGPQQSFAEIALPIPNHFPKSDPIFLVAQPAIQALISALASSNSMTMRKASQGLAGLGVGLTPAGDDFLIGVMIALSTFLPSQKAQQLSQLIVAESIPRTNSISSEWLRFTAQGELAEHWHNLLSAISLADQTTLQQAVLHILPTGHTSGADSLGAFVAASRVLLAKMEAS